MWITQGLTSEIHHVLSTLVRGEDRRWFVIVMHHYPTQILKLNFLIPRQGEWQCEGKQLPEFNIGGGDNDSESDKDDGDNVVEMIDRAKLQLFLLSFTIQSN